MQHISNQLEQITQSLESRQEPSGQVMNLQKNSVLNYEENILKVKYASPVVIRLDADKLAKEVKALIIKMNIITGWTYPDDKLYQAILEDQLRKKLQEDYPDMNFTEMEYAFRHFGTVVKDWGKSINLSLIDEVLITYKQSRIEVSNKEERTVKPPEQVLLTDQQLDDLHRGDIEAFYQRCRNGWIPEKMPEYFHRILVKDGLIKDGESLTHFFVERLGRGFGNIYRKQP
jgi:hypothetical protein